MREARLVAGSLLAPWQKLSALRMFVLPQLDFALRRALVRRGALEEADKQVRAVLKELLHSALPRKPLPSHPRGAVVVFFRCLSKLTWR